MIPGAADAIVDPAKVRNYLLSTSHPIGRFKAVFFRALGYTEDEWEALAGDLRRHVAENEPTKSIESAFGPKHEVRASLTGPNGRSAPIVSVWIARPGEGVPRLITAYPATDV